MSPSTPSFSQTVMLLIQQLARTTTTAQAREGLISQLLLFIEQNAVNWSSTDTPSTLESFEARSRALDTLVEYAEDVPIYKIIQMHLSGDAMINEITQKLIAKRKAEIPAQAFVDALKSANYPIHYTAIQGLKALGEYAPAEVLVDAINNRNSVAASIAAEAIVLRQEQRLLEPLLARFMELNWFIQLAILRTMDQLDMQIALELLEYALHYPAIEMRKVALHALGKRGKDAPIEEIENALQDGHVEIEALEALGKIAEYTNTKRFLEVVENREAKAELRITAARILLERGEKVPVQPLLLLLAHPDTHEPLPEQIKALLHKIGEGGVEEILEYAQDSATILAQLASAQILGIWGEPAATEFLTQMVHDKRFDEQTRKGALKILGEQSDETALEAIWSVLENDGGDEGLKRMSHETLQRQGQIDEHELYLPFPGGVHRINPLDSLEQRGENLENMLAALSELVRAMQAEQKEPEEIAQTIEVQLREYSLKNFALTFGKEQSIEGLALTFGRENIQEDLKQFPINQTIQQLHYAQDKRALPILQALLHHENPLIHLECVSAIHALETESAFEPTDKQDDNEIEPLLIMLQSNEADTRQEALRYSTETGGNFPIEPLLEALEDPVYGVRAEAMRALRIQKTRVPIEIFLKGLTMECEGGLPEIYDYERGDFEHPVPVEAALALGELHEERAIEPLLDLFKNQYEEIRAAALEALGSLGVGVPMGPLVEMLDDESAIVRKAACQALEAQGKSGSAFPFEPLVAVLGDNDGYFIPLHNERGKRYLPSNEGLVRKTAARTLLNLQAEIRFVLLPELKATLEGDIVSPLFNGLIACQLADLINEIGYPSPVFLKKLTDLLDHLSWEVRMKAIEAFSSLQVPLSKELEERLIALRDADHYVGVRKAAKEALHNQPPLPQIVEKVSSSLSSKFLK